MQLHPDAIPTSEQVRETLLDRFYYPYQKQIWIGLTVLAIAIVGILGVREIRHRRLDDQSQRYMAALEAGSSLDRPGDPAASRSAAEERVTALKRVVDDYPEDPITPFALNAKMAAELEAQKFDDALETLNQIRTRFKDFPLNTESIDTASGGAERSLADRMEAMIRAEKEWVALSNYTHPAPTSKYIGLIETSLGNLWIGFYEDQAPKHVANFVTLAKSGYFNGTQFYQSRAGGTPERPTPLVCEGGAAASRYAGPEAKRDPATHNEDDPSALIEAEDARSTIRHKRGVLSSVVQASGESARRFMIVAAANGMSRYDRQSTPFAMVLDREGSLGVLDKICLAPTYRTSPETKDDPETSRMRDHPYPPIWIYRVSIWRDEKLESGHAWDTVLAGTGQKEAWEATFGPAPKPSEFAPKQPTPAPVKKDESPAPKNDAPKDDEAKRGEQLPPGQK